MGLLCVFKLGAEASWVLDGLSPQSGFRCQPRRSPSSGPSGSPPGPSVPARRPLGGAGPSPALPPAPSSAAPGERPPRRGGTDGEL